MHKFFQIICDTFLFGQTYTMIFMPILSLYTSVLLIKSDYTQITSEQATSVS